MKSNHIKTSFISLLFFVILTLLLISCSGVLNAPKTPQLFDGNCLVEPANEYVNFDFSLPPPKFFVIFIDRSAKFESSYEESLDLIYKSLESTISPGDKVILAWMDYDNLHFPDERNPLHSILWDEVVEEDSPPSLPTPINTPLYIPTLTPGPGSTGAGISRATSVWVEEQNKTPEAKYHCQIGESNVEAQRIYSDWENDQDHEKEEFLEELNEVLVQIKDPSSQPKFVYDSMTLASNLLGEEFPYKRYNQYVLIFFSDMYEWRTESDKPGNYDISNLRLVDVVIAMPNCAHTSIQEECNEAQSRWSTELTDNVKTLKFMTNFNGRPKQLSDYIIALPQP